MVFIVPPVKYITTVVNADYRNWFSLMETLITSAFVKLNTNVFYYRTNFLRPLLIDPCVVFSLRWPGADYHTRSLRKRFLVISSSNNCSPLSLQLWKWTRSYFRQAEQCVSFAQLCSVSKQVTTPSLPGVRSNVSAHGMRHCRAHNSNRLPSGCHWCGNLITQQLESGSERDRQTDRPRTYIETEKTRRNRQMDGQTDRQSDKQAGGLPNSLAMTVAVVSLTALKGLASISSTVLAARALIPDDTVLWTRTVAQNRGFRAANHSSSFSQSEGCNQ